MTSISMEAPEGCLTNACEAAKDLLKQMPESTFQGEGIAITSVPGFGPKMDGGS